MFPALQADFFTHWAVGECLPLLPHSANPQLCSGASLEEQSEGGGGGGEGVDGPTHSVSPVTSAGDFSTWYKLPSLSHLQIWLFPYCTPFPHPKGFSWSQHKCLASQHLSEHPSAWGQWVWISSISCPLPPPYLPATAPILPFFSCIIVSFLTFKAVLCAKSFQLCLTLWCYGLYNSPSSSDCGVLQARILEWVAMPSSRGLFRPRDRTLISYVSCISRWVLYTQCHLGSPHSRLDPAKRIQLSSVLSVLF